MSSKTSQYYFSYGSNISKAEWGSFRRGRDLPKGLLRAIGRAILPDHALAFHYRSGRRAGGAADIVESPGHLVHGFLFEMAGSAREALDRKEGAPHCYEPINVEVLLEDGRHVQALSYRVTAARREHHHVPPTAEYLDAIRSGYADRGIVDDRMLQAAAADTTLPEPVRLLAVYGTLRDGETRHNVLSRLGARQVSICRLAGRLLDLGPYPGAELHVRGNGVTAEVYELDDIDQALAMLDSIEGFRGWGRDDSLFRRTLVELSGTGGPSSAWVYEICDVPDDAKLISNGDWCARHSDAPAPLHFFVPLGPGRDNLIAGLTEALVARVVRGELGEDVPRDDTFEWDEDDCGHNITTGTQYQPWKPVSIGNAPEPGAALVQRALIALPAIQVVGPALAVEAREAVAWQVGVFA